MLIETRKLNGFVLFSAVNLLITKWECFAHLSSFVF